MDPRKYDEWRERTLPTLEYVEANLRNRRTAIDAGAAEGLVTEWLAERFESVHAFEPVPNTFALLSKNEWYGKVVCHNVALGDRTEMQAIEGTQHSAHISDRTDCPSVHVTTLDSFDIPRVDLIKIDVEGFETRVIMGAMKLISSCQPMIMFERKHLFGTRYKDESPTTFLRRYGYKKSFTGELDTVMVYEPSRRHRLPEPYEMDSIWCPWPANITSAR